MGTLVVPLESIESDRALMTLGYRLAAGLCTGLGLVLTSGYRSPVDPGIPELPAGRPVDTFVLDGSPGPPLVDWVASLEQPVVVLETPAQTAGGVNVTGWLADNTGPSTATLVGNSLPLEATLKRLLVPLDGSPEAEQALPLASTIARTTGASVGLIGVISPVPGNGSLPAADASWLQAERDSTRSYLDEVARRLRAEGMQVTWEVRIGDAGEEIPRAAETTAANLILMASSHYGGIRSVAATTIGATALPVIVTRVGR